MKKTKMKSQSEQEIEEILKKAEKIIDNNPLTTRQARQIIDAGCKILEKCRELRESRDSWMIKCNEDKNESNKD